MHTFSQHPGSVILQQELEAGHSESIYTMGMGKCYRPGPSLLPRPELVITLTSVPAAHAIANAVNFTAYSLHLGLALHVDIFLGVA